METTQYKVKRRVPAQGVLETANSIFKRFRNAFMSQSVNEDLTHSQQFVKPLLATLQASTLPSIHSMCVWDINAACMVSVRGVYTCSVAMQIFCCLNAML